MWAGGGKGSSKAETAAFACGAADACSKALPFFSKTPPLPAVLPRTDWTKPHCGEEERILHWGDCGLGKLCPLRPDCRLADGETVILLA